MKQTAYLLMCLVSIAAFAQDDYYWVGGSGNWSDYANHWATTSGGSTFHTSVPGVDGNVFFDANSFNAASQSVTVDEEADCLDMDWTGATNFPTIIADGHDLNIYGSLTLISDMTTDIDEIDFEATTTGHTITSGGTALSTTKIRFRGIGGEWTFQDYFETREIHLFAGTLNTNNNDITATSRFELQFSDTKALNLGSSTITTSIWNINAAVTLDAGTSKIIARNLRGGTGNTYYDYEVDYETAFQSNGTLDHSCTFNSITIPAGYNLRLNAGDVFTVSNLIATGTKNDPIQLYTDSEGTQATISKSSGTVDLEWVEIQDINATGGATFTIDNATDNGNSMGWTLNAYPGADYYWVGNGGNWSDFSNHWATTSGGTTMHSASPNELDNVYFDANSFTSASQTVSQDVDGGVSVKNLDWTGATNFPRFTSGFGDPFKVYGSVTFIDAMEMSVKEFELWGEETGLTFTPGANLDIQNLYFYGSGEYDLLGDIGVGSFTHRDGTLNYNGINITTDFNFNIGNDTGVSGTPIANFGSVTITTRDFSKYSYVTETLNDPHTIIVTRNFNGDGGSYDHVIMDGNGAISGSNTFATLEAEPGATVSLAAGSTQTITSLLLEGEKPLPIDISSASSGVQSTLSVASGTVNASYLIIQDIAATGGATFNAAQTVDNGNNTGWDITGITGIDYYWVGDGGSWSDYENHWAKSSGGADMHLDLPGVLDNVIFDVNSFTTASQTVLMDQGVSVNDMIWTGATNTPILDANDNDLNVYGSLTFIDQMTVDVTDVYFLSDEAETISGGDEIPGITAYYHFTGSGSWAFQSGVKIWKLDHHSGSIDFNGQNVHIESSLTFLDTDEKFMTLGTSDFFARTFTSNIAENITFDGSQSSVTVSSSFILTNEDTNDFSFHDLTFTKYNVTDNSTINTDLTLNTLTFEEGTEVAMSAGAVVTVNEMVAVGTEANPINIRGAGGIATISQATGTVDAEFLILENIAAAGGATFNALSSIDNGNVTGWNFSKLNQTIDFPTINSKVFGDPPFDLSAAASSGLDVSFSIITGDATLDGNTVTINGAGDIQILAEQAGNITYFPAPSITQTITVEKGSQEITFDPAAIADKMLDDSPFTVSVSVSTGFGLDVSGNDQIMVTPTANPGEYEVAISKAGTAIITATQSGTDDYATTEETLSFEILKYDQAIVFDDLETKTYGDAPFELNATASSGLDVTYSSSNEGVATVSENTVTIVGGGTTIITASQAGNDNYNAAADVNQALSIGGASQAITFDELEARTYGDDPFDLTATATSGLNVSYTSSDPGVAILSGNTVTIVSAGETTITAVQDGNENYLSAENVIQLLTVNKADQAITFEELEDTGIGDVIVLSATASSGLEVSFEVSGPATLSGDKLETTGEGVVNIVASQAGNENYSPAEDVIRTFDVSGGAVLGITNENTIIYPNPVLEILKINTSKPIDVSVYTLSGSLVLSKSNVQNQLQMSSIKQGLYLLELNDGNNIKRIKIRKAN